MLRNHFGYKYHLYSHLLFWKMTCKIIFHFQALRVVFQYAFKMNWTTLRKFAKLQVVVCKQAYYLKSKSFFLSETHLLNESFGNFTMKEKSCKHIFIQISILNPIRFDPLGTICHEWNHAKVSLIFAPFVLKNYCQQIFLNKSPSLNELDSFIGSLSSDQLFSGRNHE